MKISIITPTHDARYLDELQMTILSQTHESWEWIILLNNGASFKSNNKKIRIINYTYEKSSIGMLKKYACSLATGDIIAEVDHDDLLTPNCLEELNIAFKNSDIGFVYSDNAKLGVFTPYNPKYGWRLEWFNYNGKDLPVMLCQILTPGRLGYIWFAPDHIRAWRKDIYDRIGGHNEELEICDDQDLMHRLYLETKFYYINKVLYIYRISDSNSFKKNTIRLREENIRIYNQNIYKLAFRFAEINNLKKIDLCGGFGKPSSFWCVDKYSGDIIPDFEQGIPLPNNSVGVICAHDALQHIRNQKLIMEEIHRVLAPGGILLSQTPCTHDREIWQDPTNLSFWNENSFLYWTRNDKRFLESKLTIEFLNEYDKINNFPYVIAHLEKI